MKTAAAVYVSVSLGIFVLGIITFAENGQRMVAALVAGAAVLGFSVAKCMESGIKPAPRRHSRKAPSQAAGPAQKVHGGRPGTPPGSPP